MKKYQKDRTDWEKLYEDCRLEYERELALIPSDEQMDRWVKEDIPRIKEIALEALDLEHEDLDNLRIYPIISNAEQYARDLGIPIRFKDGKQDGKRRRTYYKVVIVFLTSYNVALYECIVSMKLGEPVASHTKEFPYKEITNLETKYRIKENVKSSDGMGSGVIKTFLISTSGSNNIEVDYFFFEKKSDLYSTEQDYDEFLAKQEKKLRGKAEEASNIIRAIRVKLREYKKENQETE